MGILFNRFVLPYLSGINTNKNNSININSPAADFKFGTGTNVDKFESQNPSKYTSEITIKKLVAANPKIFHIVKSVDAPFVINMDGLNEVLKGHSNNTKEIAVGIYNNLAPGLKLKADLKTIMDAAYLHDIGKVFMPDEILNKKGKLTEKETKIMHAHSELGYELLKNTDINPKVLNMIRFHHQNAQKSGYPAVDVKFFADLDLQILSMADKYAALTEYRAYKPALTRSEALTIIRSDVREGKLNPLVYNALVAYTDDAVLHKKTSV